MSQELEDNRDNLNSLNGEAGSAGRRRAWMTPASMASAGLFVVSVVLSFLVSPVFFLLFIPAVMLSLLGLREHSKASGRMRRTGTIMVFNGIVLMLALFLVGFLRDFVIADPAVLDQSVAVAFTTVHIMLGVGLFLFDFRMTEEGAVPNR